MSPHDTEDARLEKILESLSPAEREELETNRYVKTGDSLVWIDPEAGVRSEKISNLYYIQTNQGVFRVSRISGQVVRV